MIVISLLVHEMQMYRSRSREPYTEYNQNSVLLALSILSLKFACFAELNTPRTVLHQSNHKVVLCLFLGLLANSSAIILSATSKRTTRWTTIILIFY